LCHIPHLLLEAATILVPLLAELLEALLPLSPPLFSFSFAGGAIAAPKNLVLSLTLIG
jgi:hypothetical protein